MKNTKLVFGFHAVAAALKQAAHRVHEVYLCEDRNDERMKKLQSLIQLSDTRIFMVPSKRLDALSGHSKHQGVLARVERGEQRAHLEDLLEDHAQDILLLVLDGVQDPHNLGACLRVADAMGAHAVIAPKDRAVGLSASAIKVASGAADHVPYISVTNLARSLRSMQEAGVMVVGTTLEAEDNFYGLDLRHTPCALVLGSEEQGLRQLTRKNCDRLVRIPMYGQVESMNVAVSAGIVLGEVRRQRAQLQGGI
jgi:23S rRNA (guanosine2251-2'-O)-methyltransferase